MSNNQLAERPQQQTGLSIFDSGTFEQMGMIASKLASSSLIPESLRANKQGDLPAEQVAANCFRIVEQAQRWGMSPFAVIDCASVVHGKLMWEGKLVAAALEATMGIRLNYTYTGDGLNRKVVVSGKFPDENEARTVDGTVKDWKSDQWKSTSYDQRLAYRGAREWARRHAPGVILGVYSPDEFDESDLREVNGRVVESGPVERETQIDPKSTPPEITPVKSETTLTTVKDPEGKQKKKRYNASGAVVGVAEKVSDVGKAFFVVTLDNGMKTVDMTTFSTTHGATLRELEKGTKIDLVYTVSEKGAISLESYELNEEGGLI